MVRMLGATAGGLELTLRSSQYEGMGMDLAADPLDALTTLHALAGEQPLTLYVGGAQQAHYRALPLLDQLQQRQLDHLAGGIERHCQ